MFFYRSLSFNSIVDLQGAQKNSIEARYSPYFQFYSRSSIIEGGVVVYISKIAFNSIVDLQRSAALPVRAAQQPSFQFYSRSSLCPEKRESERKKRSFNSIVDLLFILLVARVKAHIELSIL